MNTPQKPSDRTKIGQDLEKADRRVDVSAVPKSTEPETTDEKTPANLKAFHKAFERRRR